MNGTVVDGLDTDVQVFFCESVVDDVFRAFGSLLCCEGGEYFRISGGTHVEQDEIEMFQTLCRIFELVEQIPARVVIYGVEFFQE